MVEKPATLDPSTLDYRPLEPEPSSLSGRWVVGLVLAILGGLGVGLRLVILRRRRRPPIDPVQLAREIATGLVVEPLETESARHVIAAFARFLEGVDRRGKGALTPPEAREAFTRLTEDDDLGRWAERLLARCDRVCYGDGLRESDREAVVAEGRRFFERTAELMRNQQRIPKEPREAAEIA